MFVPFQPPRPDYDENDNPLLYRTQPKRQPRPPRFWRASQFAMACRLYRAAHDGAVPSGAAINDIYQYCVHEPNKQDIISKHQLGYAVVHAVMYEPRLLKNIRGEGAWMTYIIHNPLDLIYGLEWQICGPMWSLYQIGEGLDPADFTKAGAREWGEERLSELRQFSDSEYLDVIESFAFEHGECLAEKEPQWRTNVWPKYPERLRPEPLEEEKPQPVYEKPSRPQSKFKNR